MKNLVTWKTTEFHYHVNFSSFGNGIRASHMPGKTIPLRYPPTFDLALFKEAVVRELLHRLREVFVKVSNTRPAMLGGWPLPE